MVSGMVGLEAAAIYTTTFYMATVIEVPKRAMTQSATAVLSIAFEKGNLKNGERIYRQTALNQLIIGGLLMIGLWANTSNIFEIMPKGNLYSAGANVILFIGLTRLIDMSFGPSSEVIGLSRYYWVNLVVISFLAVASVVMNLYLIPRMGIDGAAVGTLIAILSYNLIKFIFITIKIGIQPFSKFTVRSLVVIGMTVGLNLMIPDFENVWVDVLIRSSALSLFYASFILAFNCSPEVTEQFDLIRKKLGLTRSL
jgi:O-antigen/teichoic acid export membrane protein